MTVYKITVSAAECAADQYVYVGEYEVTSETFQGALRMVGSDPDTDDFLSKAIRDDRFARQVPPSTGSVVCPSCSGFGEFQESYAAKGMNARIIDCPDCHGRRFVASELAIVLQRRGAPTMPDGWVA